MLEERAYQDEAVKLAVDCIRQHGGYALLAEMRTGKTVISARIIEELAPARLLIVCPEKAVRVWQDHLPHVAGREVRIILRDSIYKERKRVKRWKPDLIVADELHDFKGLHSKRSRGLRIIGRICPQRLGLTGSPQETGLEDYWPQFAFVDSELLGEWRDFKERYLVYGGFRNKKIIGYKNQEEFRKLMASRSYRVLLEDVQPVKTVIDPPHVVRFDLVESAETYRAMDQGLSVELNREVMAKKLRPDGTTYFARQRKRIVAPRAITQAMKLHQLSGGFIFDQERVQWFGSEKLTYGGALMLALGNVPQVWFVRFVPELYRLGALFTALGRTVTYISGSHKDYVTGTPFDVAVVQIASGISIDLAHAEEAILYSWDYSYLKYYQAIFRIRSYHGRRARYHYLVANNTIDEQLLEVVLEKRSFAKLVIDKYRNANRQGE